MLKPSPFQGIGEVTVRGILNRPEELYEKGRIFAHTTVYPGSGIGYHIHGNEPKTYHVINGTGTFNDNGKLVEIGPEDMTFTGDGKGHSIETTNGKPTEMIALILYRSTA